MFNKKTCALQGGRNHTQIFLLSLYFHKLCWHKRDQNKVDSINIHKSVKWKNTEFEFELVRGGLCAVHSILFPWNHQPNMHAFKFLFFRCVPKHSDIVHREETSNPPPRNHCRFWTRWPCARRIWLRKPPLRQFRAPQHQAKNWPKRQNHMKRTVPILTRGLSEWTHKGWPLTGFFPHWDMTSPWNLNAAVCESKRQRNLRLGSSFICLSRSLRTLFVLCSHNLLSLLDKKRFVMLSICVKLTSTRHGVVFSSIFTQTSLHVLAPVRSSHPAPERLLRCTTTYGALFVCIHVYPGGDLLTCGYGLKMSKVRETSWHHQQFASNI